jgi:hypothetical protein
VTGQTTRKVVQIATTDGYADGNDTVMNDGCFIALCDDGTIWSRVLRDPYNSFSSYHWKQIPGVPQDEAVLTSEIDSQKA